MPGTLACGKCLPPRRQSTDRSYQCFHTWGGHFIRGTVTGLFVRLAAQVIWKSLFSGHHREMIWTLIIGFQIILRLFFSQCKFKACWENHFVELSCYSVSDTHRVQLKTFEHRCAYYSSVCVCVCVCVCVSHCTLDILSTVFQSNYEDSGSSCVNTTTETEMRL